MPSSSQKVNPKRPGERATASDRNHIVDMVKRMIVGGTGILVKRAGDQIVIEARAGVGGGHASPDPSANSYVKGHQATTFEGLPDPETVRPIDIARVTEGDDQGMMCYVSPDGETWWSWTHWQ